MRHKELTNQKTGQPFCAPLAHVAPVSCECHLDCHVLAPVSYQHIYCNNKAQKHFTVGPRPGSPVSNCAGFEMCVITVSFPGIVRSKNYSWPTKILRDVT